MIDEHRRLRELLGARALEDLLPDERAVLDAHLETCSSCRADLAQIQPVVEHLRRALPVAAPGREMPPADLGARVARRIAAERALGSGSRRWRGAPTAQAVGIAAAAALVLASAVGLGAVLGSRSVPVPVASPPATPAPAIPLETVPVVTVPGLRTGDVSIIAHTWGVEARFTGSGFTAGERYRTAFRAEDGRVLPAGEFLGTGERTLTCSMQSALLRDAATAFVVLDADGRTVLSADLLA